CSSREPAAAGRLRGRRAARAKSTREAGKKKPPGRPGGWEEAKRRLRAAPRLLEAEPSAEAEDPRAQGFVDEAHAQGGVEAGAGASDSLQDEGLVEQVEAVHAQGQTEVLEGELLLEPAVDVDDVVEPVGVRRLELHLHRGPGLRGVGVEAADAVVVGLGIPLPSGQVAGDVEAPWPV